MITLKQIFFHQHARLFNALEPTTEMLIIIAKMALGTAAGDNAARRNTFLP
jgi:hypothetical protein